MIVSQFLVKSIVHKFPQIWNEIKRFKAILMDYYPDNKMKRNLIVVSSEESLVTMHFRTVKTL